MRMTSRHGIISGILILSVLFLQTYQVYLFHFISTSTTDNFDKKNKNSLLSSSSSQQQQQKHHGGVTTTAAAAAAAAGREEAKNNNEGAFFSACLMIMDDNAHLIEWLAYHYQVLPLRRLIIAIDPRSITSPSEILSRWDGLIKITEWDDEDFMPPTLISSHHNKQMTLDETTKLFRQRQEEFYTRCMAKLHHESQQQQQQQQSTSTTTTTTNWVALIDTDEYILPNVNAHEPYRLFGYESNIKATDKTVIELLNDAQYNNHHDEQYNQAVTMKLKETPCLPMTRLSFGVKESLPDEKIPSQTNIPYGFDPLQFQTLRWRWHGGRGNKKLNKISKSIIDLSRVDPKLFVPTEQVMVHIPIKEYCIPKGSDGNTHLWQLNAQSPLVVHHYAGTWEQWSHRKDTRGKRTRDAYDKLSYNKQADDNIRPWLQNLVSNLGYWKTKYLLRNVGEITS